MDFTAQLASHIPRITYKPRRIGGCTCSSCPAAAPRLLIKHTRVGAGSLLHANQKFSLPPLLALLRPDLETKATAGAMRLSSLQKLIRQHAYVVARCLYCLKDRQDPCFHALIASSDRLGRSKRSGLEGQPSRAGTPRRSTGATFLT